MGKNKKVKITFCGKSSMEVTNSMYLIEYNDKKILLDCGLYQSGSQNLLKAYKINHRNYKIPFKYLDAILISHGNIDHIGLVPYAYSKGATCPVYMPVNSIPTAKIMWEDSLKIFNSDCEKLSKKFDINASPLYEQDDIENALSHIVELDFHKKYDILNDTKIELFHAGHIVNACQMKLEFDIDNVVKTLTYTGDIGSDVDKDYIYKYEETPYSDIVIGETTYANNNHTHSNKDRAKDLEKIQTVIQQCCLDNSNKVLFGVFSLDRLQNVLTQLYKLYGNDNTFSIPILVDAPLGIKICNIYSDIVEINSDLWDKVKNWGNIVWVEDYETSKYYQALNSPQIILSTSNMLTSGRILSWLKSILPNENNRIMFCGYTGDNESLAYKIKTNKIFVKIDGDRVSNKANIISLTSFSSHASRQELIDRYTRLNYQKIYLVHGDFDAKTEFAVDLQESLSKSNKTSRVNIPAMGDSFSF